MLDVTARCLCLLRLTLLFSYPALTAPITRASTGGCEAPPAVTVSRLLSLPQHLSLSCVNILYNSVVSSDAFFGSVDLTNFYLESSLATPQFINIYTNLFSPEVMSRLFLLPFAKQDKAGKNYITFRIENYVRPQRGR
jgi:hypothetical protein